MAKRRDYSKAAGIASVGPNPAAGPLPGGQGGSRAPQGIATARSLLVPTRWGPYYTGRSVVIYRDVKTADAGLHQIASATGLKMVANSADFGGAIDLAEAKGADGVHFHQLGVSIYEGDPDQLRRLPSLAGADSAIKIVVPERYMFLAGLPPIPGVGAPAEHEEQQAEPGQGYSLDYYQGYYDGLGILLSRMKSGGVMGGVGGMVGKVGGGTVAPPRPADVADTSTPSGPFQDTDHATWGLQAVGVLGADGTPLTKFTGKGVRVAILDTGIDLTHPAFQGRIPDDQQFAAVSGESSVQDKNGHGTHVAGTACGPRPIGVAPDAELYICKVFPDGGGTTDQRTILAGINWALAKKCHIASMSISAPVQQGQASSPDYEEVGRRALDAGTLLVAAAGNDSDRNSGIILPVGEPANTSTFVAVGAVDASLDVANFSNARVNPNDHVDFAAPGVRVFSSWPMPIGTKFEDGTSMATPHVSGIAALFCESRQLQQTGVHLWELMAATVKSLAPQSPNDVGNGLVQAPQG